MIGGKLPDVASSVEIAEFNEDNCGICGNVPEKPRLLSCFHSFCEPCLQKIVQDKSDKELIVCNICKQDTLIDKDGISTLPYDYLSMKEIVGSKKPMVQQKKCTSCQNDDIAVAECQECDCLLCGGCNTAHKSMRMFNNHNVILLQQADGSEAMNESVGAKTCQKHQLPVDQFCSTCEEIVCKTCVESAHQGPEHKLTTLDEAYEKFCYELKSLITSAEEQYALGKRNSQNLQKKLYQMKLQRKKNDVLIEDAFDSIMKSLTEDGKKAREAVLNLSKEVTSDTDNPLVQVGTMLLRIQQALDVIEEVAKDDNPAVLLRLEAYITAQAANILMSPRKYRVNGGKELEPCDLAELQEHAKLALSYCFNDSDTHSCIEASVLGNSSSDLGYSSGSMRTDTDENKTTDNNEFLSSTPNKPKAATMRSWMNKMPLEENPLNKIGAKVAEIKASSHVKTGLKQAYGMQDMLSYGMKMMQDVKCKPSGTGPAKSSTPVFKNKASLDEVQKKNPTVYTNADARNVENVATASLTANKPVKKVRFMPVAEDLMLKKKMPAADSNCKPIPIIKKPKEYTETSQASAEPLQTRNPNTYKSNPFIKKPKGNFKDVTASFMALAGDAISGSSSKTLPIIKKPKNVGLPANALSKENVKMPLPTTGPGAKSVCKTNAIESINIKPFKGFAKKATNIGLETFKESTPINKKPMQMTDMPIKGFATKAANIGLESVNETAQVTKKQMEATDMPFKGFAKKAASVGLESINGSVPINKKTNESTDMPFKGFAKKASDTAFDSSNNTIPKTKKPIESHQCDKTEPQVASDKIALVQMNGDTQPDTGSKMVPAKSPAAATAMTFDAITGESENEDGALPLQLLNASTIKMCSPQGLCILPDGPILVADTNNNNIKAFDADGNYKITLGQAGQCAGSLSYPRKILCVPKSNTIVVADSDGTSPRLQFFSLPLKYINHILIKNTITINGLALISDEDIAVLTANAAVIHKVSIHGLVLDTYDIADHVVDPTDIAFYNEEFFVCDGKQNNVAVFSSLGVFKRKIGNSACTPLPSAIDVSICGKLLIANTFGSYFRLTALDINGQVLAKYKWNDDKILRIFGFKMLPSGKMVAGSKLNNRLFIFDALGY